jgi:hypothetical protein
MKWKPQLIIQRINNHSLLFEKINTANKPISKTRQKQEKTQINKIKQEYRKDIIRDNTEIQGMTKEFLKNYTTVNQNI